MLCLPVRLLCSLCVGTVGFCGDYLTLVTFRPPAHLSHHQIFIIYGLSPASLLSVVIIILILFHVGMRKWFSLGQSCPPAGIRRYIFSISPVLNSALNSFTSSPVSVRRLSCYFPCSYACSLSAPSCLVARIAPLLRGRRLPSY